MPYVNRDGRPLKTAHEYREQWARECPDTPYGYCWCGCGEATSLAPQHDTKRDQVKGEPRRYAPRHNRKGWSWKTKYKTEDRGYETHCWIWQGYLDKDGYGQHRNHQGRVCRAHRLFYENAHGQIPLGKQLDHLCRVRNCVRPDHLEVVTGIENTRRGKSTRLSPEDVADIKHLWDLGGLKQHEIGAIFGINQRHVSNIILGVRWPD